MRTKYGGEAVAGFSPGLFSSADGGYPYISVSRRGFITSVQGIRTHISLRRTRIGMQNNTWLIACLLVITLLVGCGGGGGGSGGGGDATNGSAPIAQVSSPTAI